LIIKPQRSLLQIDFSEMWKFRELLYIFIWRDVKVRYKQTILGVFWAVFQPVITMIIFTVFFGKLAKIPSDGIPYPIFVYSGLLLWNYFSAALTKTSGCMITNVEMIKKIYFPRLILPLSSTATPLVDFFLSFVIFGLIMVGFSVYAKSCWNCPTPNSFAYFISCILRTWAFFSITKCKI
jgi:lipopolysaccharide transport system permease protein